MAFKGSFSEIDEGYLSDGLHLLETIAQFQKKHNQHDNDTTIGTLRDCIVAKALGFNRINTLKHGFDAMDEFGAVLEIKNCSTSSKRLVGAWNDTSLEKAEIFKDENVYIAISVWGKDTHLPFFIVYGVIQSSEIT